MATTDVADTEPQEEVLDLFAKGFDDRALLDGEQDASVAELEDDGSSEEAEPSTPELPEKYRGKSLSEVIEMHQNLERAYGRHNNELGELRQLTDQILKQQLGDTTSDNSEDDDIDWMDDPKAAINRSLENNPKIKELEAKLVAQERADQLAAFKRKHPEADKVVNDPRFAEWLKASDVRVRLFQQADREYDYGIASELITQFEGTVGAVSNKGEKNAMKNAPANAGEGGKPAKKKYFKRADLARLKAEDPDRYEKLQPQILAAYAEGRVR